MAKPASWAITSTDVASAAAAAGLPTPVAIWPMWEGSGSVVNEIISGNNWNLLNVTWGTDGVVLGASPRIDNLIHPVSITGDISDFFQMNRTGASAGNPGLWRSGLSNTGTSFSIMDATMLPWIRYNGANILNASAGTALGTGDRSLATIIDITGGNVRSYIDGVDEHNATHSQGSTTVDIYNIGSQNSYGESLQATINIAMFFNAVLTPAQVGVLNSDPYVLVREPAVVQFNPFVSPAIRGTGRTWF